jgi:hypothetical protein
MSAAKRRGYCGLDARSINAGGMPAYKVKAPTGSRQGEAIGRRLEGGKG